METKNQKGDGKHKDHNNKIVLPKSYIGLHKRYHSHTDEELNNINLDLDDNQFDNNNFRFNTDRKPKRVSFNNRISTQEFLLSNPTFSSVKNKSNIINSDNERTTIS